MNTLSTLLRACFGVALAAAILGPARAEGPLYDYRMEVLDNGLQVVTLEDFSCPIVAVHLWYHVGSKDEDPQRNGFAHMFEHMMFRGTDRLGPTDHFDFIRKTGGDCNAYTAFDQTVYVQTLPANQLELALWLEAERMTFLKIDQNAFDTERKVVEEERRLGLNRPYGSVPEKALAEVFKVHPYKWLPIGNIAHLRAASVQELRDFWTRYYVPNNATLVIVGAVKHEDAQRLAKKYFGWIPRGPEPKRVTVREPLPDAPVNIEIKSDNAPAPIVARAFRTVPQGHDDYVPLQMLGSILGGGESSRVYRRIVAEEQSAVIALAAAFSLEQDGLIGAAAVLTPFGGDLEKVGAALDEEIARIRAELVSEREFEKARNQMLASVVRQSQTVESKASVLGSAAVIEGDVSRVNRQLERIREVTREDLLRVAKQYLDPQRVHNLTVQRNLLGSVLSLLGRKSEEENAPITAEPETEAPPPGRPGATRPDAWAATPPVADMLAADPTPGFESERLENGMKVVVVRNPELPLVSVRLGFESGAWCEAKTGAASMAFSMLTKGSAGHTEAQLAEELDYYAISLGGGGGIDSGSVSASCLTEQIDRTVGLMAEIVRTPTFPPEEFDKLRNQTRTGLAISAAEPSYLADLEVRRRLYGEHPYARTATGEPADLDALRVDDLKNWWQRFARPDLATLIFAGDITMAEAKQLARRSFGDWRAESPLEMPALPDVPAPSATHIYLVDKPGAQSQIRVAQRGFTRQHEDYFASRLVSGYFGGAFSSRLNETIRVQKGLTYGAGGGFAASRFDGSFRVSTFSKTATTAEAVRAILDEIDRLRNEPPSSEELEKTRSYILGSFAGDRETPQAVAEDIWQIELEDLPADYFERLLETVKRTTAEQCAALAQKHVKPDELVIVVVGPAEALRPELEKIGPVTVVSPEEAEEE